MRLENPDYLPIHWFQRSHGDTLHIPACRERLFRYAISAYTIWVLTCVSWMQLHQRKTQVNLNSQPRPGNQTSHETHNANRVRVLSNNLNPNNNNLNPNNPGTNPNLYHNKNLKTNHNKHNSHNRHNNHNRRNSHNRHNSHNSHSRHNPVLLSSLRHQAQDQRPPPRIHKLQAWPMEDSG